MGSMAGPQTADIAGLQKQLSQQDASTAAGRESVLALSRSLVESLQDPAQRAFEIMFTYGIMPCLRIAADLDIFNLVSPGRTTAQDIAKASGADKDLIVRIMRILNAGDIFKLVGDETYSPTPVSNFFCITQIRDGLQHMFAHLSFDENSDKTQNWFTWMEEHKQENDQFNSFMEMLRAGRTPWFELFLAEDVIITGSHDEAPLIVDVGGGHGHDLSAFRNKFHNSGRLVVEDLPRVIAEKEGSPPGVESLGHNFFTEQPVKGARAYFLKTILHDWPDEQALQILENIVPAMKRGYSKVLIADQVLPNDQQVPMLIGGMDLIVMLAYAAMERTECQWHNLIGDAGLVITNIWSSKTGDSIIEATLR